MTRSPQSFSSIVKLRTSHRNLGFASISPGSLLEMLILRPHTALVVAQVVCTYMKV